MWKCNTILRCKKKSWFHRFVCALERAIKEKRNKYIFRGNSSVKLNQRLTKALTIFWLWAECKQKNHKQKCAWKKYVRQLRFFIRLFYWYFPHETISCEFLKRHISNKHKKDHFGRKVMISDTRIDEKWNFQFFPHNFMFDTLVYGCK